MKFELNLVENFMKSVVLPEKSILDWHTSVKQILLFWANTYVAFDIMIQLNSVELKEHECWFHGHIILYCVLSLVMHPSENLTFIVPMTEYKHLYQESSSGSLYMGTHKLF